MQTKIELLKVLTPENIGTGEGPLQYNLSSSSDNYQAHRLNIKQEPQIWDEFIASEPGSADEQRFARELSDIFIGATSLQLLSSLKSNEDKVAISNWLTQQSIERYGIQDFSDTIETLEADTPFVLASDAQSDARRWYRTLGISLDAQKIKHEILTVPEGVRSYFTNSFGFLLGRIDPAKLYSAQDIVGEIGPQFLKALEEQDSRWASWKVVAIPGGNMSVSSEDKELRVGNDRASSLGDELEASLFHELVVHALRSINGESLGDYDAQYGIAGYPDFEEGLGCYVEYVITGKVPAKIANRQIAASMALGQLGDGITFDRNEIYDFLRTRTRLLLSAEGVTDLATLNAKEQELRTLIIDRFFRGGRGIRPLNAVFTKDTMYARGFIQAKHYIDTALKKGMSAESIFTFLLSAKFDPNDKCHIDKLSRLGIILGE